MGRIAKQLFGYEVVRFVVALVVMYCATQAAESGSFGVMQMMAAVALIISLLALAANSAICLNGVGRPDYYKEAMSFQFACAVQQQCPFFGIIYLVLIAASLGEIVIDWSSGPLLWAVLALLGLGLCFGITVRMGFVVAKRQGVRGVNKG